MYSISEENIYLWEECMHVCESLWLAEKPISISMEGRDDTRPDWRFAAVFAISELLLELPKKGENNVHDTLTGSCQSTKSYIYISLLI